MKHRKCMPDEPGNNTCTTAASPGCLPEPGSSPDFLSSSFMLACWICAASSPPHLLVTVWAVRCHQGVHLLLAVLVLQAWILCHITVVDSSASGHPDAGPWITSGYHFPWIMALFPTFTKFSKPKNRRDKDTYPILIWVRCFKLYLKKNL